MRLRVVGLILALAALLSLLFLMIAQQSLKPDQRRKQQQGGTKSASDSNESSENSPFTWFNQLRRYLAKLVGFDLEPEEVNEIFQPTELGLLNYPKRYTNSINSFVSVTVSPTLDDDVGILLTDEKYSNNTGSDKSIRGSNFQQTGSQPQTQYNDHMSILSDPKQASSIDSEQNRPRIDLLSTYRMNRQPIAGQQQSEANNDDELPHSVKCHYSKYDRLIEQNISTDNISRPILTSDGRFDNPFPTWNRQSIVDVIKFVAWEADESNVPKNRDELDKELPLIKPTFNNTNISQENSEFRATWIGHATLLIQVDGYNILTDPMFSDRASFTQFFGPKRIRQPACDIKSLPPIDIVLISHNHYDHLDVNSVRELNDRFGRRCRWIVPLGIGEFLRSMSVDNYAELDWWQKDCFHVHNDKQATQPKGPQSPSSNINSNDNKTLSAQARSISEAASPSPVTSSTQIAISNTTNGKPPPLPQRMQRSELDIYLTPSQHWSRRGVNDFNKSLWGSFVIVNKNEATFFFGGDTAYCSAFKEIGNIFGPFVGAAIPIGAYKPRWFLKTSHVDPNEAVQVHRDLKSMKSIAIHHSTFILSNEYYKEPSRLLKEIMNKQRINDHVKEPFISLKHGETTQFCGTC